ncbi:MAG: hypothetical protein EU547_01825 [Promethearchaeota archaeon]|nr:MAG: hypothetical protein EU547_01825 [Candidatus Lokiarchaeota archaeon]
MQSKVKKYFRIVEIWAWCEICHEMIPMKVSKEEIQEGLELGIYTKKYEHTNPFPDPDDEEDKSRDTHTIFVYIDENYNVTGVKSFFGDAPSMDKFEAPKEGERIRIPIVIKEVPEMSVQLGMITKEQYKVLKTCDGMNTLEQVAEITQKSVEEIEEMMDQLRDKGLVKVIKRS